MQTQEEVERLIAPPSFSVLIGGKSFTVKPLSLTKILKLSRFSSRLQDDVRSEILLHAAHGSNDVMSIIEALADEQVAALLQILLDAPEAEDHELLLTINLEEMSEVVARLTEVNDFDAVFRNFQKAAKNLKGLLGKISKPSLPSSPK